MHNLGLFDWTIIVTYLAGIVAFGVYSGRAQSGTKGYFLGNRNISWWAVGLSIVATETSAVTFISIPALAYATDLTFIQIVIGYVIARIILAIILVPRYFKGEIYSPYQLLADRFGPGAQTTAAVFFMISGLLAAGVRVYVTCIPIQLMLGFSDNQIAVAVLLFVGLSLIYTYVGGIRAVVWTDAVQFFLLAGGGLFVIFFIPSQLEGGWGGIITSADEHSKLRWLDTSSALGMPYNIWMGLFGATFLAMATHGADQLIVQRVLACKNVTEGRRALALSAVIILPLFLLFLLVGICLWAFYESNLMQIAIPEARPGVGKNDYVFPIFILTELPVGVRGVLFVAILSAAMSSVSSALSALASVSIMDVAKRLGAGGGDDVKLFRLSKFATLGWAVLLAVVAIMSQKASSVLTLAFSLNGLTAGALLCGVLLAVFSKSRDACPVIAGMITSLVVMVTIHFVPKQFPGWWANNINLEIAWPWYTLIGLSTALVTFKAVSLFSNRWRSTHSAS